MFDQNSDIIQINTLTFAPFGNQNRDESGHPKTMQVLGSLRQRWSPQSQKAAIRGAAHTGQMLSGTRSRNMAIDTYTACRDGGLPERLCFAAAEIVRASLGGGEIRKPSATIEAACKLVLKHNRNWPDDLRPLLPEIKASKPKAGKTKDPEQSAAVAGEPETAEESGSSGPKLKDLMTVRMIGKGDAYRLKDGTWPASWEKSGDSVFEVLGTSNAADMERPLLETFRADQPLLFSSQELVWKVSFEAEIIAAWQAGNDPQQVAATFERHAPKGRVVSPMPTEALDADIALGGRMVASLPEATVEAAMRIAHSMSISEFQIEADFFTAREERPLDRNDTVGHMGHGFWGAAIHHRAAMIDMRKLRENLSIGDRTDDEARAMAEKIAAWFVETFSTTIPSGKSTNSASYSPASYVLIERGGAPCTNLAVAFSSPIPADAPDKMVVAIARMREFKAALAKAYGSGKVVEVCAYPGNLPSPQTRASLAEAVADIVP